MYQKYTIFFSNNKTQGPILNFNDVDQESQINFIKALTEAVTGAEFAKIPLDKQPEIIEKSLNLLSDYIFNYIEAKYPKAEVIKLKTAKKNQVNNIFEKFQNLQAHFFEAFEAFLKWLNPVQN